MSCRSNIPLIIQVDTREKENAEIIDYFLSHNQRFFKSKLHAGDYIDFKEPKVSIDVKKNLEEVSQNLTKDHQRFLAEISKCKFEMNCDFVVLIREPLSSLEDVKNWNSERTKMTGKTLYKIMCTMAERYGVIWRFCSREKSGEKIVSILKWYKENK